MLQSMSSECMCSNVLFLSREPVQILFTAPSCPRQAGVYKVVRLIMENQCAPHTSISNRAISPSPCLFHINLSSSCAQPHHYRCHYKKTVIHSTTKTPDPKNTGVIAIGLQHIYFITC